MSDCPCGSGALYTACCGPYIDGEQQPPTAEALMRARYSAHTLADMDFLVRTHTDESRELIDVEVTRRWAERCEWLGLDIVDVEDGQPGDEAGVVEFVAHYREREERQQHRERALFEFDNGRWMYADAEAPQIATVRRDQPKIGRNDPCPCGSGRKYKKCCG